MTFKFYVSLVKDLLGYYIEFEADSKETVRKYLEYEYYDKGTWKLPWCSVYDAQEFEQLRTHRVSIKAKCGVLLAENFE